MLINNSYHKKTFVCNKTTKYKKKEVSIRMVNKNQAKNKVTGIGQTFMSKPAVLFSFACIQCSLNLVFQNVSDKYPTTGAYN